MAKAKIETTTGILWEAEGGEEFVSKERAELMKFLNTPESLSLVRAALDLSVQSGPYAGTPVRRWVDGTVDPALLKQAISEGRGLEVLRPFDEVCITLDNGRIVPVVCGFMGEDFARFVFRDCYCQHTMNEDATNEGGYFKSDARRFVLEDIYPHLPKEWKDLIRPRTITEYIGGEKKSYTDPLWLPSATDVFGPPARRWWREEPDSFQLPIFSRERDRVKELMLDNPDYDGTCYWWCRSPYATYANFFCSVNTNGNADPGNAYISGGFAPGFDF